MKLCVSELEGRALNYAVAFALWGEPKEHHLIYTWGESRILDAAKCVLKSNDLVDPLEFNPSENWAHGGKLIGAYKVKLCPAPDGYDASIHQVFENHPDIEVIMHGSAPLQATCLCVVKFLNQCADEIEIPDELCEVKS